ncbi:hypothetical protein ACFU0W_08605 [Microbacterium keratanolyticum]|uniref:hypothetical protein n=1 Tax=Microbacterium keratanolyticum TaxID=67574 RepID=UPI00366E3E18
MSTDDVSSLTERYLQEEAALHSALDEWAERLTRNARRFDSGATVSGRVKSYRSFLGKAYRRAGAVRTWEQFGDLVALKAIFPTRQGVDLFSEWLNEQHAWSPSLDEKEGSPSELKYQAKQFDLCADDITDSTGTPIKIEVQVRTAASDAWYVVDHRLQYKGMVELTSDLKRKLNRLIVLTELFDEEVDAVIKHQATLPEYAAARLYEGLIKLSESLSDGYVRTTRPEGLLELVLRAYTEREIDSVGANLQTFTERHRDALVEIITRHHHGSESFLEARDWIYYEPEALLIAERAAQKPALLRSAIDGSDFQPLIEPMIGVFQTLKKR